MNLAVIGTGYVGLVTGTCFAEMGSNVICIDNDQRKIDMLKNGKIPIYEPGLEDMVKRNVEEGRLSFSMDLKHAVQNSLVLFIAVGTPPDEDGSADLKYVLQVANDIASYMDEYKVIVDKSTVPVGTADDVRSVISKKLKERNLHIEFDVVSNPEFLKEGDAIDDFMKPDRIIIGVDNQKVAEIMKTLYAPFNLTNNRVIMMSIHSAELTKYAANSMLATKISFMNEVSQLCEKTGADVNEVRIGIGSDTRIGYKFIYPGVGYGGSCFPKDVQAMLHMSKKNGLPATLLHAVEKVNERQKHVIVEKIKKHFGEDLTNLKFAIWGLSFKPQTDDMREAPSLVIIRGLLDAGAEVIAYDPVAMDEAKKKLQDMKGVSFGNEQYQILKGADAMLLITEWHQFRYPDFNKIKSMLNQPVVFDGRNQYEPNTMREMGFTYYSIGRP
ncbi:MAG TPA: UDP-glucose/GDP-mannose dehydrogenase family protein [Candidatus Cloacimonadota bacterium]|nr:UDP-glucose/GDP-mannose dehydrogenase family protein [Candidatus Cloacimonadota bacterium]